MPIEVSSFTAMLMDKVQIIALLFMALVYALKIWWILSYKPGKERTPSRGDHKVAIWYSYTTLVLPWELPSARKHWFRWVEFAVFHVAVTAAIAVTFIMPYWPRVIGGKAVVLALQVLFAIGFLTSLSRLFRRLVNSEMRLLTSPDDVFCLVMLAAWMASAVWAAPQASEPALIAFFGLTAFFLVYVPFSKISHYILWPFIRYYTGKHFGHRGVYPPKAIPSHA